MQPILLALPPDVTSPGGSSPGGGGGMGGILVLLVPVLIIFILMPLFNKKDKHRRKRLEAIKKHDRVVTSGGIFGTITAIEDSAVTLEIARDVRIRIKRSSVFDLDSPTARAKDGKEAERGASKARA